MNTYMTDFKKIFITSLFDICRLRRVLTPAYASLRQLTPTHGLNNINLKRWL